MTSNRLAANKLKEYEHKSRPSDASAGVTGEELRGIEEGTVALDGWLSASLSDVVWRMDRDWRWSYVTSSARELLRAEPADLIGRSFKTQFTAERRSADLSALELVLGGTELNRYTTVIQDRVGGIKEVSIAARPIRDENGAVIGVEGVTRDETEVAHSARALTKLRDQAERDAEAKGSLLANTSHEIRTPMNGIIGMADLLLNGELEADQRRSAELIKTSAESLLSLLNDILDFSRIEAGGLRLVETRFDLHSLVDSVVRLMAVNAFEKGVEMAYDIRPDVPHFVRGDPGRLRQVLANILRNAIKFTDQGEIALTIGVAKNESDDLTLTCAVRDTGIGIEKDRADSIFEEYAQGSLTSMRTHGGTGLGLAISRRLVRLMGGEITVDSEVGNGSTFSFDFVVAKDTQQSANEKHSTSFDGLQALVVGHNSTSRSIICDILGDVGIQTQEAASADTAAAMLSGEADGCSIAIIDSYLPGRDGFHLASVLKEKEGDDLHVMMLTSAGQRGDARRCREIGVAAYLTKPVSRPELLEALSAMLNGAINTDGAPELVTRHSITESRDSLRVLVVEDNVVNQTVAASMLRQRGHVVETVDDGLSAVEAAQAGTHDVILMDLQLPELDGFSATAAIRALPGRKQTPIVAVTAYNVDGIRDKCLASGFDRFLLKPYHPHELFASVEGWADVHAEGVVEEIKSEGVDPVDMGALITTMREAGIEDAVGELLDVFATDAPLRMGGLQHAFDLQSAPEVEAAAHVFRSASATIRATRLSELLDEVEWNARSGSISRAADIMTELEMEYEAVMEFLTETGAGVGYNTV